MHAIKSLHLSTSIDTFLLLFFLLPQSYFDYKKIHSNRGRRRKREKEKEKERDVSSSHYHESIFLDSSCGLEESENQFLIYYSLPHCHPYLHSHLCHPSFSFSQRKGFSLVRFISSHPLPHACLAHYSSFFLSFSSSYLYISEFQWLSSLQERKRNKESRKEEKDDK